MFKNIILKSIRSYQRFISPLLGIHCRFYPSCSEYGFQVIKKHGLFKGTMLSVWRVLRCNPWNEGGINLP